LVHEAIKSEESPSQWTWQTPAQAWQKVWDDNRRHLNADLERLRQARQRVNWTCSLTVQALIEVFNKRPVVKVKTERHGSQKFYLLRLIGGSLEVATECDLLSTDYRSVIYDVDGAAVRWQSVAFNADYDAWQWYSQVLPVSADVLTWLKLFTKREQGLYCTVTVAPDGLTIDCPSARQKIKLTYYKG
jgi:hypothetical protein